MNTAIDIAERDTAATIDANARVCIQTRCPVVSASGHVWHDMEGTRTEWLDEVTDALAWLETRGDALPYQALRHAIYPNLIRFAETAP